jgi:hypothetical protein
VTRGTSLDFSVGQIVRDELQLIQRHSGYRVPGGDSVLFLATSVKKSSRSHGTFDVPVVK